MKLDSKERLRLIKYQEKIERVIFGWGIGIPVFLLVFSFIPAKFIPSRKVGSGSDSLIDLLGFLPVFLFVVLFAAALIGYFMYAYKYLKIKDDVIERNKVVLNVKVHRVIPKSGNGPQEIELRFYPPYKGHHKLDFIDFPNFPLLQTHQIVEIEATQNALHPLSIKPKDSPMDDLQEALKKINQSQNQGR